MISRVTSRATCQGTRTRGVVEVVDDESSRGEVVDDEPARGEVVDNEPCDVPRHPNARRRQRSRQRAARRAEVPGHAA
jgi:hypothetical protein